MMVKKEVSFEEFYKEYFDHFPDTCPADFANEVYMYLTEITECTSLTKEGIEEILDRFIHYTEDEIIEAYGADDINHVIDILEKYETLYYIFTDKEGNNIYSVEEF